jgi:predicted RNA-binding Zn-ribbon protein involved in translation (DUF1610 family)
MKGIFESCILWEKKICINDDFVNLHRNRMNEGKQLKSPDGTEFLRINEICAKCNFPLDVNKRECPVCGNKNLQEEIAKAQSRFNHTHGYRCDNCGRILIFNQQFD